MSSDVKVFARFRPFNKHESHAEIYDHKTPESIEIKSITNKTNDFTFDQIFPFSTTQEEVYQATVAPLVQEVLQGFNCTAMVYGQTGSGKSYSMTGNLVDEDQQGITPRIIKQLFEQAEQKKQKITFQCSYIEIYMEKVRDLLNPELDNLKLREMVSKKVNSKSKSKTQTSLNLK